jgi:DNA-binding CsgD family transcriptional regulator
MVFREVSVIEIREALRAWLAGKSERAVAAQAGVDRKTSRRYVTAAVAAGLSRAGGEGQLTDELIGQVVSVVRPVRPDGHGQGWAQLEARQEEIAAWVKAEVPVVKIGNLLARQGVVVAERTLHRFAAERCGAAGTKVTTPVDDGPPGSELQIDFGYLGLIPAGEGRRRKLHALVHRVFFPVPVRLPDVLDDAGGGHRRVRGRLGVFRRGLAGDGPGQHEPGGGEGGRGQPAADPGMAGIRPGQGFRDRPGPGPASPR